MLAFYAEVRRRKSRLKGGSKGEWKFWIGYYAGKLLFGVGR